MQDWCKTLVHMLQVLASLALSPLYLASYLCRRCFEGLCGSQDVLFDNGGIKRHAPASQLPQEVLLQIFDLLRTRARFGQMDRLLDEFPPAPGTFSACRDLAAARLVCGAWHGAATQSMYADVTLVNARACITFAAVLVARPQLARFVRRVVFPRDSRQLSNSIPADWSANFSATIRQLHLKAAIDRVMVQCSFTTDVTFFRETAALEDVPGLMQCAERVEHLSIHLVAFTDGPLQIDFTVDTIQRFPRLQSLTLQRQRPINISHMTASTTIRSLHLGHCSLELPSFHALLAHLPNLRSLFWRENSFHAAHCSILELFSPRRDSLAECTLIDACNWWAKISLIDLDKFGSLRRLTLSAWMLSRIQTTPPSLVELIISTAPYQSYFPVVMNTSSQMDLLYVVLTHLLPGISLWRELSSPSLRLIELWDTVILSQLPRLKVISYILHAYLEPLGFEVSVNLFLEQSEVPKARRKLRRRNRRLLWQADS